MAASFGILTLSLSDVDEVDFPALLGLRSSLWTKSFTIAAAKVVVRVLPTPTLAQETVAVIPENLVYSSDGTELGQIGELVKTVLTSPCPRDYFISEGKEEHVWFEMAWVLPRDGLDSPLFLKKIDPETLREIESIQIKGPCTFEIAEFGMRRGKLGDIDLAWGKTEILGRDAIAVATRDNEGVEKLSINFAGKPPTGPVKPDQS